MSEDLGKEVQEAFDAMTQNASWEGVVEPQDTGFARQLVLKDGRISSAVYHKRKQGIGEPLSRRSYHSPGTFFFTQMLARSRDKNLFLTYKTEFVGEGALRVVLRTNDRSYVNITTSLGLKWKEMGGKG